MLSLVKDPVLLTITGVDRPGITASLTKVLAENNTPLLDIEQVVVHKQLTLCILIDLAIEKPENESVLKDLLFVARQMEQSLYYRSVKGNDSLTFEVSPRRYVITVLGSPLDNVAVNVLATLLAKHEANITSLRRLSFEAELSSLEVSISLNGDKNQAVKLKSVLMSELAKCGVDVALQKESLTRRNKRLVVLDMDSTTIQVEVIDELAKFNGVEKKVSALTEDAMNGKYDFSESLRKRVQLLKGLTTEHLLQLSNQLPLTAGAKTLVTVLKGLGYKVGIISGGFHVAADVLKARLGLDFVYANRLETKDGVLTGNVIDPIVDAEKKADLLEWIAHKEQIPLSQTIAIGDGANDALMLAKAGLGIAYHAKPALKKLANTTVSSGGLDRIFYLLGMNSIDIKEFLLDDDINLS